MSKIYKRIQLVDTCRARSEIRPVRMREFCVLIVMECKPVVGADDFREFAAVGQIDHDRRRERREGALILDRKSTRRYLSA
jgi:hypothetical protein